MYASIVKLYGRMDSDTTRLFTRFVARCLSMDNPNEFLKTTFRTALQDTEPSQPKEMKHGEEIEES